jgi:hypothetical protein
VVSDILAAYGGSTNGARTPDVWRFAVGIRHALRDAFKAERAERKLLERTRSADAQLGSLADTEDAEALWPLQTIARVVLMRHAAEATPAA